MTNRRTANSGDQRIQQIADSYAELQKLLQVKATAAPKDRDFLAYGTYYVNYCGSKIGTTIGWVTCCWDPAANCFVPNTQFLNDCDESSIIEYDGPVIEPIFWIDLPIT